MSAGSQRKHVSLRTVRLSSLSDELDELLHTTHRYDDPEPLEDLDALPDDDVCTRCGLRGDLDPETGLCQRHNKRGDQVLLSQHGTRSRYTAGCRCRDCRDAARNYMRERAASQHATDLPAIPAESAQPAAAQEEAIVAITSSQRVVFERPAATGRASRGGASLAKTGRLKVPADIAELIPTGTEFVVELSEQGLIFLPLELVRSQVQANLPAWTKNGKH